MAKAGHRGSPEDSISHLLEIFQSSYVEDINKVRSWNLQADIMEFDEVTGIFVETNSEPALASSCRSPSFLLSTLGSESYVLS